MTSPRTEEDFIAAVRRFRRRCWVTGTIVLGASGIILVFNLVTGGLGR
jgi:hypothetical protein